jgi:hypothetical protein
MAIINKTGITNGGTIEAEHITRAIDALSSIGTDTIIATGSFSGSLTGLATSASFAVSASRSVSSSFATTASLAQKIGQTPAAGDGAIYVNTGYGPGQIQLVINIEGAAYEFIGNEI